MVDQLKFFFVLSFFINSISIPKKPYGNFKSKYAKKPRRTQTSSADRKDFKICTVLGGLDITRLVSSNTRNFFQGAIEDVELIREVVSESSTNEGISGGKSFLSEMNETLDWEARGFEEGTTTMGAGLGYVDDRSDRRMERFVSLAENYPFTGDKQHDMQIVDSVSNIFPWIIDRKSRGDFWHVDHQNGKSQGKMKEPFLFDSLYTAAWIGSYGESWAYYPPMRVYGHPLTFGDILSYNYDSHEEEFVQPNLPENNPSREAFFTTPYPDSAVPGLSLITAMAPVYFSGTFRGVIYNDTYVASTGVDIAVSSVSSLLDVLEHSLTASSFGILVDSNFNTIVISQSVVEKIYPERTGFEEMRVTYDKKDGSIVDDRRNQTYLVSDTILQPLTDLSNANWTSLLHIIQNLEPGERETVTLDITITGENSPTPFHVMFERWQYVADWVLLVFAPIQEVQNAISIDIISSSSQSSNVILQGVKGRMLTTAITIINNGTLDLIITPNAKPNWAVLDTQIFKKHVLKAGQEFPINLQISTYGLDIGTSSDLVSFIVEDDHYPDCFHKDNLNIPISVKVMSKDCVEETGDSNKVADMDGNCVCQSKTAAVGGRCIAYTALIPSIIIPLSVFLCVLFYIYVGHRHKIEDSVWVVKPEELHFDDPPIILGRGTFGLVLLAEYRGTNVAVKRVIPPRIQKTVRTDDGKEEELKRNSNLGIGELDSDHPEVVVINEDPPSVVEEEPRVKRKMSMLFDAKNDDHESGEHTADISYSNGARRSSMDGSVSSYKGYAMRKNSMDMSQCSFKGNAMRKNSMDMSQYSFKENSTRKNSMDMSAASYKGTTIRRNSLDASNSSFKANNLESSGSTSFKNVGNLIVDGFKSGSHMMMSGTSSFGSTTKIRNIFKRKVDEYSQLKSDFIEEMRQLSKLRHPCITTVMGAVISKKEEPMLVMECMDHGSLYDILHNDTMIIEGDFVLSILRDIAQGLLFLHSASPQVIHGDLKAQNVLVDIKFRAKVADFGLSQKKKMGATGTPLWMAPELLRGENINTAASDVYSFGIILYEVYSRQSPYEGEDLVKVLIDVCNPLVNKRPPFPKSMPPSIVSLMSDCLVSNPEERPMLDEIASRLKRLDIENVEPSKLYTSKQAKKLEDAEKNYSLLLEVFPKHIAEALRDGRKVEPEQHDCVTIYFSDIVGFTTISGTLSPAKVSDMLDRLYLAFDELSHKHGVWKIETIGDAWMGVTNLVTEQEDSHASRIARFAIDAIKAAGETLIDLDDPSMGYVNIRVGMHSGPVLSNVVGSRTPKFSIFGDTVNTSSRMESNSIAGYIQSSTPAALLLMKQDPDIPIKCRGAISVKGKGEMTTYWVNRVP